jgi:hypothetical protein
LNPPTRRTAPYATSCRSRIAQRASDERHQQKRRALLQIIEITDRHHRCQKGDDGQAPQIVEPPPAIEMERQERQRDKEPSLQEVGLHDRDRQNGHQCLGNVELQPARLLAIRVLEPQELAVDRLDGFSRPQRRDRNLRAGLNERERKIDRHEPPERDARDACTRLHGR